jgi:hypothetical protein
MGEPFRQFYVCRSGAAFFRRCLGLEELELPSITLEL